MIDFACKQFAIDEIIRCAFNLSKADCLVFEFFLAHPEEEDTAHISKKLKLNLSTVQRAVKKLHEKNVIKRRQANLSSGGYVFLYSLRDKKEIRAIIIKILSEWTRHVEKKLLESWP